MKPNDFEKRCLALNIGYDHDVCDGRFCQWKLTCLRYMLHKKAELEGHPKECLYYIQQKFTQTCYKKYGQEDKQENR